MENIRFSENIAALRKKKKITQEQLADFCGVTKASVSKWETRQSMPDISLLPRLAGFFGVTIDELIGYEAYLTKEQIQKIYDDLSTGFVVHEFAVVMEQSREYVRQYYSCYDFLGKIVLLWLNHFMLAGENAIEILKETKELCEHILENCRDIRLCNDTVFLKAIVDLQLGDATAVIEALEDVNDPCRLSAQGEEILLSAYMQAGMIEKANDFAQVVMYLHLLALVSDASSFLGVNKNNLAKCEETCRRIEDVICIYNLEEINFNVVARFAYQMAAVYCQHGEKKKAVEQFQKYADLTVHFLREKESHLECDAYFDRLTIWFEKNILGGNLPRDKKLIYDSLLLTFDAPEFEMLRTEPAFLCLQKSVKEIGKVW